MKHQTAELEPIRTLEFSGKLHEEEDLSAIAHINGNLLIGADEGHTIQLLTHHDQGFKVVGELVLNDDPDTETDIEDICCQGNTCYIVGSHSRKRKKTKPDESQNENRKRLYKTPKAEPDRATLYQVELKSGKLVLKDKLSLQEILEKDKLLNRFLEIPSKENGIDIEGLAIANDTLYIGFRSPVLRENYVPILQVEANTLDNPTLQFIRMKGRGVRAMTEVEDGLLILGGPPGDGEMSYQLYFWNKNDMVIGNDVEAQEALIPLGQIPTPSGAKAEGLSLLNTTRTEWEVLVVYDGVAGGEPTVFQVSKP